MKGRKKEEEREDVNNRHHYEVPIDSVGRG